MGENSSIFWTFHEIRLLKQNKKPYGHKIVDLLCNLIPISSSSNTLTDDAKEMFIHQWNLTFPETKLTPSMYNRLIANHKCPKSSEARGRLAPKMSLSPIQKKDLQIQSSHSSFLQNIKTSLKPAEMLVYEWSSLPINHKQKISKLIGQFGGKQCDSKQNIYSSDTRCFRFSQMKHANSLMDQIDRLHIDANIDISHTN